MLQLLILWCLVVLLQISKTKTICWAALSRFCTRLMRFIVRNTTMDAWLKFDASLTTGYFDNTTISIIKHLFEKGICSQRATGIKECHFENIEDSLLGRNRKTDCFHPSFNHHFNNTAKFNKSLYNMRRGGASALPDTANTG